MAIPFLNNTSFSAAVTVANSATASNFITTTDSGININGITLTRVAANSAIRVGNGLETLGLLRSYSNLIVATTGTFGGDVSVEDNLYLTDSGTVRGKLILNSSDRDNVELRAESLGSTMKFFTVGTEALGLDASQNATFQGDVEIRTGKKLILQRPNNGVATEISTDAAGTMILNSVNDEGFKFQNAGTTFLTLDTSNNATFTGLVSGITPVNAANFVTKAYVDGGGGGTGPFLPLAGGTLTGLLKIIPGTANNTSYDALVLTGGANSTSGSGAKMYLTGTVNDPLARGTIIEGLMTNNSNAHALIFSTSASSAAPTERMRIDSSGNIAIGRTSASKRLDINLSAASGEGASIILRNTSAGSGAYNRIYFAPTASDPNTRSAIIEGQNTDGNNNMSLIFKTSAGNNPTEKMRISQTGAIKFNTYGAGTLVTDANGNITVSSGGGAGGPFLPLTAGSTKPLSGILYAGQGVKFTGGTIASATTVLHTNNVIYSRGGSGGMFLQNSDGSDGIFIANDHVRFDTGGTERIRITSAGNVGIGTTLPGAKLTVEGNSVGLAASFTNSDATNGYGVAIQSEGTSATRYALILRNLNSSNVYGGVSTMTNQVGFWGIGASPTNTLGSRLTVGGNASIGSGYTSNSAPTNGLIVEGNVGIRNNNPQSTLHLGDNANSIGGTLRLDSFVANQFWKLEPGTNTLNIKDYDGTSLASFDGAGNYVLFNGGNVGIGVTGPTAKLHVSGGTKLLGGAFAVSTDAAEGANIFSYKFRDAVGINNPNSVSAPVVAGYVMSVGRSTSGSVGGGIYVEGESRFVRGLAGGIKFNAYDGTNQVGTPTYILGTDATGNVVKVLGSSVPGSVSGSGTVNTIPLWTPDGNTLGNSIITQPTSTEIRVSGTLKVNSTVSGYSSTRIQTGGFGDSQSGINILNSTTGYGYILFGDGSGADLYRGQIAYKHGDDFMAFNTAGSQRMTINSSGNVGIGTTSPNYKLDVIGSGRFTTSSASLYINSSNSNGAYVVWENDGTDIGYIGSGYHLWSSPNNIANNLGIRANTRLDLGVQASVHMTILNSGNVGIGTTAPSNKLAIKSGTGVDLEFGSEATSTFIQSYNRTSSAYGDLRFVTSGETMRLTNTGKVGIGTTGPGAKLEVKDTGSGITLMLDGRGAGTTYYNSKIYLKSGSTTAGWNAYQLVYNKTTAGADQLQFIDGSGSANIIFNNGGSAVFAGLVSGITPVNAANFVTKAYVDGSGGGTGGPFLPLTAGSTKPLSDTLHINSTSSGGNQAITFERSGQETYNITHGTSGLFFTQPNSTSLLLGLKQDGDISIYNSSSSEYVRFDQSTQRVGIGTTSPSKKLDVAGSFKLGTNAYIEYGAVYPYTISTLNTAAVGNLIFNAGAGSSGYESKIELQGSNTAADDAITFTTGSSTAMVVQVNGNVGIGTTSPLAKLQVGLSTSNSGSTLTMFGAANNGILSALSLVNTTGNDAIGYGTALDFHVASTYSPTGRIATIAENTSVKAGLGFFTYESALTEKMRITNNGNVGIGTTTPQDLLNIHSASASGNIGVKFTRAAQTHGFRVGVNDSHVFLWTTEAQDMAFATSNSQRMIIQAGGNVGIGITNPTNKLDIEGVFGVKRVGVAATSTIDMGGNFNFNAFDGYSHVFKQSGTERVRILPNGNVGIGTTTPRSKLQVGASATGGTGFSVPTAALFAGDSNVAHAQVGVFDNDTFGIDKGGSIDLGGLVGGTGSSPYAFARISGLKENSTSGNYAGYFEISTTPTSSLTDTPRLQINSTGSLKLHNYDGTNKTGTATFLLGTDANGNVIKTTTVPSGSGGPFLPLAGGTLTGALAGTSASFTGALSSVGYSGTSGTFSASVTASGNSNSFGNTTTAALTATSGTFSASVTAAGNSNSFGATTFTGNVNTSRLFVEQSGADMIDMTRTGVGTYRFAISSSDAFSLFDVGANADRLVINSSGNVGIGTTSPSAKFTRSKYRI